MYGFETTDENILKNINKRTTLDQFQNAIVWTRAAKINIRGAFMLGNPGETSTSLEKTIDYAKNCRNPTCCFQYYHSLSRNNDV